MVLNLLQLCSTKKIEKCINDQIIKTDTN